MGRFVSAVIGFALSNGSPAFFTQMLRVPLKGLMKAMYWPSGEICAPEISGSPKNSSRSMTGGTTAGFVAGCAAGFAAGVAAACAAACASAGWAGAATASASASQTARVRDAPEVRRRETMEAVRSGMHSLR